ncbi:MAG: hypothetical protein AMXMBFR84_37890 [Candidatus Hydrogenedentota bacterium]
MIGQLTRIQIAPTVWIVSFDDDLPGPFYWYAGETLVEVSNRKSRQFQVSQGQTLVVSVFDDPGDLPGENYPSALVLDWQYSTRQNTSTLEVIKYRLEEWVTDEWVTRGTVLADVQVPYYTYETPPLADGETHLWRIVPVGEGDIDGTPAQIEVDMVCSPAIPGAAFEFEATAITLVAA